MNTAARFNELGYVKIPSFLPGLECQATLNLVQKFHAIWMQNNESDFQHGVINSSNLTRAGVLDDNDRLHLFQLISSDALLSLVKPIVDSRPCFMGTQLFFDPYDSTQANYWHRDCQYHLDLAQQQQVIAQQKILHCRIALKPEFGIELIPGTHKRWDTEQELAVRSEQGEFRKSDDLPNSQAVDLAAGDLLIFSANMLHRGLYGKDRYALDILFCEDKPELKAFLQLDSLPNQEQIALLANATIFE